MTGLPIKLLGLTGHCKYEQWTPTGDNDAAHAAKKESANAFVEHLHSMMDHPVSQWCQIYQLKDVQIKAGETPEECVECICNLTDRCGFPDDAEKECHTQFWFGHAPNDPELVLKLLAMKIDATTSQMLETCQTHIAIADNMSSMGLSANSPKSVNTIQKHPKSWQQKHTKSQHECGNCTKKHPLGRASCPAKDSPCNGCSKKGHWQPQCCSSQKTAGSPVKKDQHKCHHGWGGKKQTDLLDVANDGDHHYMRAMSLND